MSTNTERKLACLVCRHRKVACDRGRPKCGLCEKNGFDCEYKANEYRPGLKAGYVSKLEKRVERLEKQIEEVLGLLRVSQQRSQDPSADLSRSHTEPSVDPVPPVSLRPQFQNEPHSAEHIGDVRSDGEHFDDDRSYPEATLPAQMAFSINSRYSDIWLQIYHPWFPILHHTSVTAAFSTDLPSGNLVRKSITAATIWDIPELSHEEKLTRSDRLSQEVILKAMDSLDVSSLQALLILAILAWGDGNWLQCSNILAICKRISHQLGAPDFAGVSGSQHSRLSLESVKSATSSPVVAKEEIIRVFWMIQMPDSIFALGSTESFSAFAVPPDATFPCGDTNWALQEPCNEDMQSQGLRYSSGFSMCISLCTVELDAVHRFQRTVREDGEMVGGLEWQSVAQKLDESLTIWREEFVAAVFRLINTNPAQDARAEMEPFIVLTNCILNMAVICLLQSQTSLPPGVNADSSSWPYANHRCMYACENMAAKIRRMEDSELRNCSPCLILPMFVAARFYIVHTKCMHADVSVNLHSLAYALYICSYRWPLAKMFEFVIRTAVAEHRTPVLESTLPAEFYDLRYSVIEISRVLKSWVNNMTESF